MRVGSTVPIWVHRILEKETVTLTELQVQYISAFFEEKSERIPRPFEPPPVGGKNVKTFRWDYEAAKTKPLC